MTCVGDGRYPVVLVNVLPISPPVFANTANLHELNVAAKADTDDFHR